MQYMLLIYGDERLDQERSPAATQALFAAYGKVTEDMKQAGILRGGEALKPTSTATTVRVRKDKPLNLDGPFAETKEQLGGYYIIDVPNLDEALAWAAKIPTAVEGSIEVRPVMVFE
jgi:hypothetical protein